MSVFRCREVGYDEPDDAAKVEAYNDEYAAAKFVEERYSAREYYDQKGDIRIGVRPSGCKGCGGYGIEDVNPPCPACDGENLACVTCEGEGCLPVREVPCTRCVETIYVVETELVPSCHATVEKFTHPTPPHRCYACGQRMDNGADHSFLGFAPGPGLSGGRPGRYACDPTPSPEVIDHDRLGSPDPNP